MKKQNSLEVRKNALSNIAGKNDYTPNFLGRAVSGRPIYQSTNYLEQIYGGPPSGEKYSEWTRTIPYGGKWVSFPSVDRRGHIMSEDDIMKYLKQNGPVDPITGEIFPMFENLRDAVDSAKNRSSTRLRNVGEN